MANFHQLYNDAKSADEKELILKKVIRKLIHIDQRKVWENTLATKYNVVKAKQKNNVSLKNINWFSYVAVAAGIIFLVYIFQFSNHSQIEPQKLALQYLQNESVHHPGLIKGISDLDQKNRLLAISFFDSNQFEEAIDKFNLIEKLSYQDQFYLGLSYLNSDQALTAIPIFEILEKETSTYKEEINWFLSIAYVLSNNYEQASNQLLKIQVKDWNYQKGKKLYKYLSEK